MALVNEAACKLNVAANQAGLQVVYSSSCRKSGGLPMSTTNMGKPGRRDRH